MTPTYMTPTEYLQRFDPTLLKFLSDPPDLRSEEFWLTAGGGARKAP